MKTPEWIKNLKQDFLHKFNAWIKNPKHKISRIVVGVILIVGGALGFLPILGYWMIPLGLSVLAVDFPAAARANQWLLARGRTVLAWWRLKKRQYFRGDRKQPPL